VLENKGKNMIAGIDEAGRGPLAGPVIAAAVILNPEYIIEGLADSKQLTEKKREYLFEIIKEKALSWSIGRADSDEIDRVNILQATFLAMRRAVSGLHIKPQLALVDGNQDPKLFCETKTIINGDQLEPAISAASIIAKVTRDREMLLLDQQFPEYGFAKHKGYPTKHHIAVLEKLGPCQFHRRSYAPVARVCI
jgi:ribonuclease HII